MPPKHTVDTENQGALFADTTKHVGAMTLGTSEVVVEGGYFPDSRDLTPPLEAPAISTEEAEIMERRNAELRALNSLALENRSRGNVENKTNLANRITQGVSSEEKDTSLEDISQQINKSRSARDDLMVDAKDELARACGIEVYKKIEYKIDTEGQQVLRKGNPVIVGASIVTKDPKKQAELDAAYRKFRIIYAGTKNTARRDARRKELR